MKTKTFKSYSDCQHGWVAVKKSLLVELGIADSITRYSYERGATVYLEEDCDLSTFYKAFKAATGEEPVFTSGKYQDRSPIRSYKSYDAPKVPAPKEFREYRDTKGCVAVKLSLLIELGIAKDADPLEEDWIDCNTDMFTTAYKAATGKVPVF